jgi:hypothetical protein
MKTQPRVRMPTRKTLPLMWSRTKKLIVAASILLGIVPLLGGTSNPAAQQLLLAAKQQAALFNDRANPFQLEVDFVAQVNVPAHGHVTLKWEAKNRWWRRIEMGDFEQTEIRNSDKLYISRNVGFTPARIRELIGLLQFAEESEGLLVKKEKQRVENGVQVTCLWVERESVREKPHQICVNSASHEILSDEWQLIPDEQRREQYAEYFDFEGHRYPRRLELLVNGIRTITAEVRSLTTAPFDETLLVPPKGSD